MAETSSSPLSPLSSHISRSLFLLWAAGIMLVSAVPDPPVFIFGDSTVDVGTNNYIPTTARANFPYYGIDFLYSKPTGRFSNGYNGADEIAIQLGNKQSPPPYLALLHDRSTFKSNLLQGVNFASGGAGILDGTGLGDAIPLSRQVQQFATVRCNITQLLGQNKSDEFIAKTLFVISIGSSDLFDNYQRTALSQAELMAEIQSNYAAQLTALYNLGARKFGIVSVPPIGCCPQARLLNLTASGSGCLTELNNYAQAFYSTISRLLRNLSSQLPGMMYSLGDAYAMTFAVMKEPLDFGIANIDEACCGGGRLNAQKRCFIGDSPNLCPLRDRYLFWDSYHPTQHAARLAAIALFTADQSLVAPMNFSQLVQAGA